MNHDNIALYSRSNNLSAEKLVLSVNDINFPTYPMYSANQDQPDIACGAIDNHIIVWRDDYKFDNLKTSTIMAKGF